MRKEEEMRRREDVDIGGLFLAYQRRRGRTRVRR
jgi:hypothetical protein